MTWLLCRAGKTFYALPTAHVVEIMRILPVESIAGALPYMRGLCIIRGTPVGIGEIGNRLAALQGPLVEACP